MLTKYDKVIFFIIIALPLVDIITTFTVHLPLSFGAIIRTGFMFFLFVYLWRYYRNKHRLHFLFIASFFTVLLTFVVNFFMKRPFLLFEEIQFTFKTTYYVMMIFTAFTIISERKVQLATILRATGIASLIIGVSYWIAIITKTNISSYTYIKTGYSGWFFSANELSVIVLILLTLAIVQFHLQSSWHAILTYSIILSMTPMIGTKTAFYGGIIIAFSYLIFLLFSWKQKMKLALITSTVLFIILLPLTPAIKNETAIKDSASFTEQMIQEEKVKQMLSSRDIYLAQTKQDYAAASFIRKLVGLGYAGDYNEEPKTIEMDFYELFFSYGIIGFVLLLAPLLLLSKKILTFRFSITYLLLLLTCALCVGIAFVAGHVLFAPAVMSYVALLSIVTGLISKERSAIIRGIN